MSLWLLQRKGHVGYDEAEGFVIRASNEVRAREIARHNAGDEDGEIWLRKSKVTCTRIAARGKGGVVLKAFNAG